MASDPYWLAGSVEKLVEENVDIVSMSHGSDSQCLQSSVSAGLVNDAYADGILWFNSMNNNTNCGGPTCNARSEAAASGSIAVAQYDGVNTTSLDSKTLCARSSDGADRLGRRCGPDGTGRPLR